MGSRIDINIHPQRHGCHNAHCGGNRSNRGDFGNGFGIDLANAARQCLADIIIGFANAGKHNICRINAGGLRARQFTRRHNIHAAAKPPDKRQNPKRRICLHGEMHLAGYRCHCGLKLGKGLGDAGA